MLLQLKNLFQSVIQNDIPKLEIAEKCEFYCDFINFWPYCAIVLISCNAILDSNYNERLT